MGASVKRPRQFLSISTLISFILISLVRPIVDRLVRSVFIVALAVAQRRTAGQQQGIEDQEAEQNTRPRKTTQDRAPTGVKNPIQSPPTCTHAEQGRNQGDLKLRSVGIHRLYAVMIDE